MPKGDLPRNYRQLFAQNSKWFKHTNIPGTGALGEEMVVTIEDVDMGMIGEGADVRAQYVFKFEGQPKKFGCNTTNADTIAGIYGEDPNGWIGRAIVLYRDTTKNAQGGRVECIRIRPYAPRGGLNVPRAAMPARKKAAAKKGRAA